MLILSKLPSGSTKRCWNNRHLQTEMWRYKPRKYESRIVSRGKDRNFRYYEGENVVITRQDIKTTRKYSNLVRYSSRNFKRSFSRNFEICSSIKVRDNVLHRKSFRILSIEFLNFETFRLSNTWKLWLITSGYSALSVWFRYSVTWLILALKSHKTKA